MRRGSAAAPSEPKCVASGEAARRDCPALLLLAIAALRLSGFLAFWHSSDLLTAHRAHSDRCLRPQHTPALTPALTELQAPGEGPLLPFRALFAQCEARPEPLLSCGATRRACCHIQPAAMAVLWPFKRRLKANNQPAGPEKAGSSSATSCPACYTPMSSSLHKNRASGSASGAWKAKLQLAALTDCQG